MSFPTYPKYKDSGVEWLGKVPAHWMVDRLKRSTLSCQNGIWGDEPQQDDDDIPCVRVADFDRQRFRVELTEPTIRNVKEKERAGRVLNQGDLLIEKSGGGETQPVGCVVLYEDSKPAVCSNFIARVKVAANMNASFWRYFHAAAYSVRLNTRSIKQTSGIQNLDASQYFDERTGFPPPAEQAAIAAFLEHETAKIDDLELEQQRLIDLLREKRQALISHAVTKGMDPLSPMKASGIEWLDEMPQHWRVSALKHLAKPGAKTFTDGDWIESPYITNDGVRLIQTGNIGIGVYKEQGYRYVSRETFEHLGCTEVEPRDVLICRLDGPVGRACLAPDLGVRMLTSVDNAILKTAEEITPEFIVALLSSVPWISWIDALCRVGGGFRLRVSRSQLGELRLPIPPQAEQISIAGYLQSETEKWNALIAEAQRAIELLQRRRTALIFAAVTGQIDVRNAMS